MNAFYQIAVIRPDEGIALGMFEDANLAEGVLTLSAGEGILLFSPLPKQKATAGSPCAMYADSWV